jgi:hypothetical protein
MRLFHRPKAGDDVPVPGLAEAAAARGWQPAPDQPFSRDLHDMLFDLTFDLYGVPRGTVGQEFGRNWKGIGFHDAFCFSDAGRTVTVANARTHVAYEVRYVQGAPMDTAVCSVELPAALSPGLVQPRRYRPMLHLRATPTGDPAFDESYLSTLPPVGAAWLTPEVKERLLARGDWILLAFGTWLVCVTQGWFATADAVLGRVDDVLDLVARIPASVVPHSVDRSVDDLAVRIAGIDSIEQAIAFLQGLTDADRERLARSDTPLAGFADVRTAEEAMTRFQSLDQAQQMQLMGLFMRASGGFS